MRRFGFIGGGRMAEALLKGGLAAGVFRPEEVLVSTPGRERREYLRRSYRVEVFFDNPRLVRECEAVVLAVKWHRQPAALPLLRLTPR